MIASTSSIPRSIRWRVFRRSLFLQASWNPKGMQNLGLAWALYGFGTCYEYSRDPHFLETAESCADYYITHSPADGVAPWFGNNHGNTFSKEFDEARRKWMRSWKP